MANLKKIKPGYVIVFAAFAYLAYYAYTTYQASQSTKIVTSYVQDVFYNGQTYVSTVVTVYGNGDTIAYVDGQEIKYDHDLNTWVQNA